MIYVRGAKGEKDLYTILSDVGIETLNMLFGKKIFII